VLAMLEHLLVVPKPGQLGDAPNLPLTTQQLWL
jgi:hypothetical protein